MAGPNTLSEFCKNIIKFVGRANKQVVMGLKAVKKSVTKGTNG